MKKLFQITGLMVVSFALLIGCGKETTAPTDAVVATGTINPVMDSFMATIGDTTSRMYYVYTPPRYDADMAGGYPTVYMLHGFGGNENYFVGLFNAVDAADWLLSRGDIEPMILVFPSGHTAMGGSFYTNSPHPAVGSSEDHIMSIVTAVDAAFNTNATAAARAIGGNSMGGYGAFSIAMNHPGMFGNVAAIAGPLALWGTMPADSSYMGVAEPALLGGMLAETGYDSVLEATGGVGDLTAYQAMMYPAPERRLTSMLFAMGSAFSPTNPASPVETSTPIGVDLPIGVNGQLHMPTWSRWMAFDVVTRFSAGQVASLAGVHVFLDAGDIDDLGLNGAHMVMAGALALASMPPSYANVYTSNMDSEGGMIKADHSTHTFERIKQMLIWVSGNF